MNIQAIKKIVHQNFITDEQKAGLILQEIAKDENAIKYVLELLKWERKQNKELIKDSNEQLSRALVVLSDKNLRWNKKIIADPKWVITQIKEHYMKWKDTLSCNFKINGLS